VGLFLIFGIKLNNSLSHTRSIFCTVAEFDPQSNDYRLAKIDISLDTATMLRSMVDQARILVFKAVASATKTTLPQQPPKSSATIQNTAQNDVGTEGLRTGLNISKHQSSVNFSSTSNIARQQNSFISAQQQTSFNMAAPVSSNGPGPEADRSPRLHKARSSALRLNSVLYGKGETKSSASPGLRSVRSVKWDTPGLIPKLSVAALAPSPKKPRVAENGPATVSKLKSFKSFGRPHGGDAGSGPRNATFGEYGGRMQSWGRDGRLAHHPVAFQQGLQHDQEHNMGMTGIANKNATFDLSRVGRPSQPQARGGLGGGLGGGLQSSRSSLAIPRTTTGLEKWLVKSVNR
jgi:hypothetical protein